MACNLRRRVRFRSHSQTSAVLTRCTRTVKSVSPKALACDKRSVVQDLDAGPLDVTPWGDSARSTASEWAVQE